MSSEALQFHVKVTLPKDLLGGFRRDAIEEKQNQVQTFIKSKLRLCINFGFKNDKNRNSPADGDDQQIQDVSMVEIPPLELHIHLHVL